MRYALVGILFAGVASAQGVLLPYDDGYVCEADIGGTARSDRCELSFYPDSPAGYLVRFAGRSFDFAGDPFRDPELTINGRAAIRERGARNCYAFSDGSGRFCIGE